MRVPAGHKGVVVCDTRRAHQWEGAFARAGLAPVLVESAGEVADKGDWEVCVPAEHEREAKALVTAVVQGRAELPSPPFLSTTGARAGLALLVVVAAVFAAAWLTT